MPRDTLTVAHHYLSSGLKGPEIEKEFDELLEDAENNATGRRAIDFVADMRAKFDRYGINTFCSEKQFRWLESIARSSESDDPEDDIRGFK